MSSINGYYATTALLFLFVLLLAGYLLSRRQRARTTADFAVASRQLGAPRLVLMNVATYLSAVSLIGFTGYGYASGFALLSFFFGTILGHLPLAVVSRRLHEWKVNSLPEFFGQRYGNTYLRNWFAIIFICIYTMYLMLNLVGVAVLLNSVAGLPAWLSELVVLVALLTYVALGGMRTTSLINSVQAAVILVVVIGGAIWAIALAGGFGSFFGQVRAVSPVLMSASGGGKITAGLLLGTTVGWMGGVATRADFGAQALSGSRARVAGWTLGLPAIIVVVVYFCLNIIGLSARVHVPNVASADAAFPLFFKDVLPGWTGWLMIIALLSGITAACDSYILTISTMVGNDIVKPLRSLARKAAGDADRVAVRAARITVLVASAVAYGISLTHLPLLALATLNLFIIWGSACFVPLYAGLLWRGGSALAAGISSLVGGALGLIWIYVPVPFGQGDGAVVGIVASLIVYVALSMVNRLTGRFPQPSHSQMPPATLTGQVE
ncbi:MAG TPA: sodium:solute symporter family protein [Trebonia sp.]